MRKERLADDFSIRRAQVTDLGLVRRLAARSVGALLPAYYTPREIPAVRALTRIEPWLIQDGTYYVAEIAGRIAACGGWSFRQLGETAMDANSRPGRTAFIRALFVDPDFARRGLGSALLANAEMQAARRGYEHGELMATLGGVPLYLSAGWRRVEDKRLDGPGGIPLSAVLMDKPLELPAGGSRPLERAA